MSSGPAVSKRNIMLATYIIRSFLVAILKHVEVNGLNICQCNILFYPAYPDIDNTDVQLSYLFS